MKSRLQIQMFSWSVEYDNITILSAIIKHARNTRDLLISMTLHSIEAQLAQEKINPPLFTKALQPTILKSVGDRALIPTIGRRHWTQWVGYGDAWVLLKYVTESCLHWTNRQQKRRGLKKYINTWLFMSCLWKHIKQRYHIPVAAPRMKLLKLWNRQMSKRVYELREVRARWRQTTKSCDQYKPISGIEKRLMCWIRCLHTDQEITFVTDRQTDRWTNGRYNNGWHRLSKQSKRLNWLRIVQRILHVNNQVTWHSAIHSRLLIDVTIIFIWHMIHYERTLTRPRLNVVK